MIGKNRNELKCSFTAIGILRDSLSFEIPIKFDSEDAEMIKSELSIYTSSVSASIQSEM